MFAELEPASPATDTTRAPFDSVLFQDTPIPAPMTPPVTQEPSAPHDSDWPEALADAFEWPSEPGAASPSAQAHGRHAGAQSSAAPDLTLEALEGVHSAAGFEQITLEPGALAAFTGAGPNEEVAPASEKARALEEFFQGPEEPPLPPVEDIPAPATPAPPAISPTDYPARLAAAREMRENGSLDDALVEYRALLKNAPDLLPDVLSDLEASLDEQPEHPELHRLLGDARIRQGDYMAALESLNRSVSLTQNDEE